MSGRLHLARTTRLSVSADAAFAWHARPGAFQRLVPPWERVEVIGPEPRIVPESRVTLAIGVGPVTTRWVARHHLVEPGRAFRDIQESGPFESWLHTHRVTPLGPGACELSDEIECEPPGGSLGGVLLGDLLQRRIVRALAYRHAVAAADLAFHDSLAERPRMRVVVSGASGLVGSTLCAMLTTGGHQVTRLVRRTPRDGEGQWDPIDGRLDPAALEGADAVVHLAGENIAGARWSDAHKRRVLESRVWGTALIAETMGRCARRPGVLVSASAFGYYGDRGDEELDESSGPGEGFLTRVTEEWERATEPARACGARVARLRFGVVLSPAGGALERMLPPFRLGLGGPIAGGRQWQSWLSIDDAASAIVHTLCHGDLSGPVNCTAPQPVRNADFTRILAAVLGRPAFIPLPASVLRLLFGQLADEGLLASIRVRPAVLLASGYRFRHPGLEACLRHVLGRAEAG